MSWMRREAAALEPSTARNALVRATAILEASKGVTAPLRRITWKPGSLATARGCETVSALYGAGAGRSASTERDIGSKPQDQDVGGKGQGGRVERARDKERPRPASAPPGHPARGR